MLSEMFLELNPRFFKVKIAAQIRLNKILFDGQFLQLESLLPSLQQAMASLSDFGLVVSFFSRADIEQCSNAHVKDFWHRAETYGKDNVIIPYFKKECRTCKKTKKCNPAGYYPLFRGEKLFALMCVDGKNLVDRLRVSSCLDDYFKDTAAKISHRVSDDLRSENLFVADQLVSTAREAVVITDLSGTILRVNKSFTRITGYDTGDAIGKNPKILKSGKQSSEFYKILWSELQTKGYWSGEFLNRDSKGNEYSQKGTIVTLYNHMGKPMYYAGLMEDVTKLRAQENKLTQLEQRDPLTSLPNRNKIQQDFDDFIIRNHNNRQLMFMLIGLDDFKHINDAMGHSVGDNLLSAVAKRLLKTVSDEAILYRFGGDMFAIVAEHHDEKTITLAESIISSMSSPFYVNFRSLSVSCSIGIAIRLANDEILDQLVSRSEIAMYSAKRNNKRSFVFATEQLDQELYEKVQLKAELINALTKNEFHLVYQPKYSTNTLEMVGAEALIRWEHPELGFISPVKFIPIAESCGQIIDIDFWVIRSVIEQIAKWRVGGILSLPIAVNISMPTFIREGFVDEVESLLDVFQIAGHFLEFEVTERIAMSDQAKALEVLQRIKNLGISISIDDFGTGYSSLSYLHTMPFSKLKIDRSFVSGIDQSETKRGITGAITAMAKVLKITTIAEGVETKSEIDYLRSIGCDQIQGFLMCKPMSLSDYEEQVRSTLGTLSIKQLETI
ncbi:EAL domain-containing protein [Shewanella avicenniae]|uniref:EAL domain-containing protein n=1 Tax=Shewanella avicenniae TaxID=2814294 RepID=A0ABX7QQT0_9GAMM|nr:EAL domain-containing protein [Shewanella avicenniae]QSX33759.1 EAL domain-containing protein [Shewanella avicenniae]